MGNGLIWVLRRSLLRSLESGPRVCGYQDSSGKVVPYMTVIPNQGDARIGNLLKKEVLNGEDSFTKPSAQRGQGTGHQKGVRSSALFYNPWQVRAFSEHRVM